MTFDTCIPIPAHEESLEQITANYRDSRKAMDMAFKVYENAYARQREVSYVYAAAHTAHLQAKKDFTEARKATLHCAALLRSAKASLKAGDGATQPLTTTGE